MNTLIALSFMAVAQVAAEAGPVRPDFPDVLFQCDFKSETWFRQWGAAKSPERTKPVLSDPKRKFEPLRGRALQVHVDRGGHYGLSLAFPFRKSLGYEPEQAYFRYYLRFADDWTPKRGGKLPEQHRSFNLKGASPEHWWMV